MRHTLVVRARIIGALFSLAAALLIVRLYFLQVVHGTDYREQAVSQYVEQSPDTESRGNIFFTTKTGQLVSAAVMQTGWRIAVDPSEVGDAAAVYARLSALTPVDEDRFMTSAGKQDDPYEEVAFRVDDAAATKIRALKIPGVTLISDQWRFYPAHELAAQTVGFVGYQGDTKVGVYGLEKKWQDTLSETVSGLYVNPFAEIFTNLEAAISSDPAAHQGSIITSIEPSVEQQLEKTLNSVMKTYSPRLAGGIVMDPHTGEIVAMAGRPAFDPNTYGSVTDPSVFQNPLVDGRYEMGSIMKPLTMAAAIDAGAVTPKTTYNDTGCITRSNKRLCNFDFKARGVVPMQQILSQSLNVGATFLADTMGHPAFTLYMKSYQLDQPTGIDMPNEVSGDLSTLGGGNGPDVNYATASFGQGVAVSAVEMTRALATLANGGVLPNPHVVTGIRYDSGITRSINPGEGPRVLSTTTAETVTKMLQVVYDDALLDGKLKMQHYTVAAKTGTAQIPDPSTGTYYTDRYLHSFFGYFPANDPKFIIFLFVVEPHGVEYASASLARPFYDVMQYLINYYAIPPDR
ncbi:penicillin-binding protein 2 [Candidatus Kaiserbacteria bacterium]|nr:penicillin-binding protein 2 [Candidatus Kaiserbacteria bacterium]